MKYDEVFIESLQSACDYHLTRAEKARKDYAHFADMAAHHKESATQATRMAAQYSHMLQAIDPEHADRYSEPDGIPSLEEPEVATALRQMADLIAAHPALAEHCGPTVQHSVYLGTVEEQIRRVEELADELGVPTQWRGSHYGAWLNFGGGADFHVVATTIPDKFAHLARVKPAWYAEPEADSVVHAALLPQPAAGPATTRCGRTEPTDVVSVSESVEVTCSNCLRLVDGETGHAGYREPPAYGALPVDDVPPVSDETIREPAEITEWHTAGAA